MRETQHVCCFQSTAMSEIGHAWVNGYPPIIEPRRWIQHELRAVQKTRCGRGLGWRTRKAMSALRHVLGMVHGCHWRHSDETA